MPSADSPNTLSHSPIPPPNPTSKPFSISLGTSKAKPSKPTTTTPSSTTQPFNPKKRPHSSLNDESDSETDDRNQRSPQLVSAFDRSAGGAISVHGAEKANEPLVIKGLKNRNWREETRRKRGKNLLPAEVQEARRAGQQANGGRDGDVERDEVGKAAGLSFVQRGEDGDGSGMMDELVVAQVEVSKPKTADEEALEALMGDGERKSTLVVPAVEAEEEKEDGYRNGRVGLTEDDMFRSDVSRRPDSASLDDYARVPVEEFGLGMLRGMGWKEGEVVGKRKDQVSKARIVERRPALLGIGAKEVPGGIGEELGAWGKAAKGKRKVDNTYNPVLLKNSKTGETLTEEELRAKREKQKDADVEWRDRRDRNLAVNGEKKSERKRKEERQRELEDGALSRSMKRERSRSVGSRHSFSRRERSRSPSRRHGSSKRERSRSRERRHHGRRSDYDEDESREKHHRRRPGKHDRDDESRASKYSHDSRDAHDDIRRGRHEVY
ncbi:MAG: hypothetical protein Q9200_000244 [Gallowayella weberi]